MTVPVRPSLRISLVGHGGRRHRLRRGRLAGRALALAARWTRRGRACRRRLHLGRDRPRRARLWSASSCGLGQPGDRPAARGPAGLHPAREHDRRAAARPVVAQGRARVPGGEPRRHGRRAAAGLECPAGRAVRGAQSPGMGELALRPRDQPGGDLGVHDGRAARGRRPRPAGAEELAAVGGPGRGLAGCRGLVRLPGGGRAALQPLHPDAGRSAAHRHPRSGSTPSTCTSTTSWSPTRPGVRRP